VPFRRNRRGREQSVEEIQGATRKINDWSQLVPAKRFPDLGRENADTEELKELIKAEIYRMVNRDELSVRAAHV